MPLIDKLETTIHNLSKCLFSFEMVFVLFIFSYQYKHLYPFLESPDITLLLCLVVICSGSIIFFKTKTLSANYAGVLFLMWAAWVLTTAFWSPNYYYTLSKSMCLLLYTIPAFFVARCVIGPDESRFYRFYHAIVFHYTVNRF